MKMLSIILITLYTSVSFSGGESDGGIVGGNGGGPKISRSIASIEEPSEKEIETLALDSAKKCLKKLDSKYLPDGLSQSGKDNIKKEIINAVLQKRKEGKTVDSVQNPDCVYYANEINEQSLKRIFFESAYADVSSESAPSTNTSK